jgi:hypothetical protein
MPIHGDGCRGDGRLDGFRHGRPPGCRWIQFPSTGRLAMPPNRGNRRPGLLRTWRAEPPGGC